MKKKFILLFLLLISIAGCFYFAFFTVNSSAFGQLIKTDESFNKIVESCSYNEALFPDGLTFNNQKLLFDKSTKTYYYSLVENDENATSPFVSWDNDGSSVFFKDYAFTSSNIKNNIQIECIIYKNDYYNTFSIAVTTLPLLNITVNESHEKLWSDAKSTLTLFDNRENIVNRTVRTDCLIHVRGVRSTDYEKKSFRIHLITESTGKNIRKNSISLLGFRNDDDYILNGIYTDPDKVRQVFSTNLWYYGCSTNNSFGIENGNEYKYVEMFIDNEYEGLYALTFPIDSKQVKLDEDETLFYSPLLKLADFNEEAIREFEIKSGKDNFDFLIEYFNSVFYSENKDKLLSYVDIDNAIDILIFYNLVQGLDNAKIYTEDGQIINYLYNTFITVKYSNDEEKVVFTPWDLDYTFGLLFGFIFDENYYHKNFEMSLNPIYKLLNDEEIKSMIKTRYNNLRNGAWSNESLEIIINKCEEEIFESGAFLRDKNRFPESPHNDSNNLSDFRKYVFNRFNYFDKYINGL